MANYRQIQTYFWRDTFVSELTPEEKFFYMYIITNPNTTQCGIYFFVIKFAEVETGYNSDTIKGYLENLRSMEKSITAKKPKKL